VKHTTSRRFWQCFDDLPAPTQALARKNFKLLKANPGHPSLDFKLLGGGKMYSARVGIHYRALGLPRPDGVHWFWIGTHGDYDKLAA
jgi:hypothetical protein